MEFDHVTNQYLYPNTYIKNDTLYLKQHRHGSRDIFYWKVGGGCLSQSKKKFHLTISWLARNYARIKEKIQTNEQNAKRKKQ
jgi:hypothetical protein